MKCHTKVMAGFCYWFIQLKWMIIWKFIFVLHAVCLGRVDARGVAAGLTSRPICSLETPLRLNFDAAK